MAETFGSLCDKLTIIKLKQFHSLDEKKLNSLRTQEEQLKLEMDCFLDDAISGIIPNENLSFSSSQLRSYPLREANSAPDTFDNSQSVPNGKTIVEIVK